MWCLSNYVFIFVCRWSVLFFVPYTMLLVYFSWLFFYLLSSALSSTHALALGWFFTDLVRLAGSSQISPSHTPDWNFLFWQLCEHCNEHCEEIMYEIMIMKLWMVETYEHYQNSSVVLLVLQDRPKLSQLCELHPPPLVVVWSWVIPLEPSSQWKLRKFRF